MVHLDSQIIGISEMLLISGEEKGIDIMPAITSRHPLDDLIKCILSADQENDAKVTVKP